METQGILQIKENYGFRSLKNAVMPFAVGAAIFFMDQYNRGLEAGGDPGPTPTSVWVVSGLFFFLGFVGLFFRRKVVFDKGMQKLSTQWRLLFFDIKSKYAMSDIQGVEMTIGEKFKATQSGRGSGGYEDFVLKLNLKTMVDGEPEPVEHNVHLYRSKRREKTEEQAKVVCEFLDKELRVVDHRRGIDKIVANFFEKK